MLTATAKYVPDLSVLGQKIFPSHNGLELEDHVLSMEYC